MNQDHPVRFSVDYPDRPLDRLTTAFRIFTVIPIALVLGAIGGYAGGGGYDGGDAPTIAIGGTGLLFLPPLLMVVFREKYPRWWYDWNLELLRFTNRVGTALEDRFLTRSGSLGVEIDGKQRVLGPAEEAAAPPGTPHRFWNAGDEPATFIAEVRPASEGFIAFIETLYGLARDGKTNTQGLPNLLQAAVLFRAYKDDVIPASPPPALQPIVFGALAVLGKLLGFRARYPAYSRADRGSSVRA